MDSSSIELVGSEITAVTASEGVVRVHFERTIIIKMMTGSVERTKWWQKGDLVLDAGEIEGDLPQLPALCLGGDVGENIYTYRDMIPLPLESHGQAHCDLRVEGDDRHLIVRAEGVRLEMEGVPKYIEHIRPD